MALFLDSSVVIDLLRGADYAPALVAREPLYISPITVHEVLAGMRDPEEARTVRLLEGLIVVPAGRAEATLSGNWSREFSRRGITLELEHTMIAAAALLQGLPLATGNVTDFPIPDLRVEEWRAGRG